jgi:hypothetical protein
MKRILTVLLFANIYFALYGQSGNLGLHGKVTWLTGTKISVEYDWSDDSQLLDWTPTNGSSIIRGDRTLTITGGVASVSSIIWKQLIKCTGIYAEEAKAVNAPVAHLNFITNVIGWTGYDFNPPEIIGLLFSSSANYWLENGVSSTLQGHTISLGKKYTIDIEISDSKITSKSSDDNLSYSRNLSSTPDMDRQVAIGGYGGDTEWGKIIIEGEVNTTWQPRSDMIDIQSGGATFSPVIEVTGNSVIEWIFNDETTSSSVTPAKNYGSPGIRHNLLKVTPWSALIGINAGYDAADGGYGGFDMVPNQNIMGFQNLNLAESGLQYLCVSQSPLAGVDLSDLAALRFVELVHCQNLVTLKLGNHPVLERISLEDCNLTNLDISGSPELRDFRAASNNYPSISWGTTGAKLWHICTRSNNHMTVNIPVLTNFPLLRELLIWDDNQTGPFVCHSSIIQKIEANDNHYSSLDISGCTVLRHLALSGSQLASVNLGSAPALDFVQLKDCALIEELVDYVLKTIDEAGPGTGTIDLTENAAPSSNGMVHYNNLKAKGWTVNITDPGQTIMVREIILNGADGISSITADKGTLQINALVTPVFATDNTLSWSVVYGSKLASVDDNGLVKAIGNGTVRIRAAANDGSGKYGELTITIANQVVVITEEDYNIGKLIVTFDELVILFDHDFTSWKASLYNLSGNIVNTRYVEGEQLTFNISSLPPGLYIVVLNKGQSLRVAEFVKP